MSKTRGLAKRKLDQINGNIENALEHLKDFEAMGYGQRDGFNTAIVELATALMMVQQAVDDIKNWI